MINLKINGVLDTMDIPVTKVWDDENDVDGIRPTSVTL